MRAPSGYCAPSQSEMLVGIHCPKSLGTRTSESADFTVVSGSSTATLAITAKTTVATKATNARVGHWFLGGRRRRFMAKSPVNAPGRNGMELHKFHYSVPMQGSLSDKSALRRKPCFFVLHHKDAVGGPW